MIDLVTNDPVLRALYGYWRLRRGSAGMPDRRDIDPVDIPAFVLPNMMMLDLLDRGARARYRLIGTGLTALAGGDHTGRFIDDVLSGTYLEYVRGLCREIYESGMPIYTETLFRRDAKRMILRRLSLPLANGSKRATIALVGQVLDGADSGLGDASVALSTAERHELRREIVRRAA
ncbi:MAG: PAS domain-containing protein [Alphaproteobacteria bacterium]|nr:PAS domain-containing protein [Alphaproteobacteria bacterium]